MSELQNGHLQRLKTLKTLSMGILAATLILLEDLLLTERSCPLYKYLRNVDVIGLKDRIMIQNTIHYYIYYDVYTNILLHLGNSYRTIFLKFWLGNWQYYCIKFTKLLSFVFEFDSCGKQT